MSLENIVKENMEKAQKDFHEFKESNDKRLEKVEKAIGGLADYDEKLEKINAAIDEKMEKVEATVKRIGQSKEEDKVGSKEQKQLASEAFQKLMRGKSLSEEEQKAYNAEFNPEEYKNIDQYKEIKTLSIGSDADGGYLVRPEISTSIGKKLFESSPMRQLATVQTIGTDEFQMPYDDDEPDASWVGESETRAETDSNQLKMIRIFAHEMYAEPKATRQLLEDAAINVEAWHGQKVAEKFARLEATAYVAGSGAGRPKGILSYAAGTSFDQLQQVNSGSAGAFTADGLIDLQTALFEEFQGNASWMMQRASAGSIRKLKNADGSYLWSFDPVGGLNESPKEMLLGKPVYYANDMQAIASGALAAAYGDFRQGYMIVDRVGISVLRDPYTSKGFVKFHTRKRTGGGVVQFQAIKIQKLT